MDGVAVVVKAEQYIGFVADGQHFPPSRCALGRSMARPSGSFRMAKEVLPMPPGPMWPTARAWRRTFLKPTPSLIDSCAARGSRSPSSSHAVRTPGPSPLFMPYAASPHRHRRSVSAGDEADFLVAFYQHSYDEHVESLKEGGVLLYDSDHVEPNLDDKRFVYVGIPITGLTVFVRPRGALHRAALWGFVGLCGALSPEPTAESVRI